MNRGGGALERHWNRVRLDLGVAAETQQRRAQDLGRLASQRKIAQAGCDVGACEGKCSIAHVPVLGLRGHFIRGGEVNQESHGILTDVAEHSACRAPTKVSSPTLANVLRLCKIPWQGQIPMPHTATCPVSRVYLASEAASVSDEMGPNILRSLWHSLRFASSKIVPHIYNLVSRK